MVVGISRNERKALDAAVAAAGPPNRKNCKDSGAGAGAYSGGTGEGLVMRNAKKGRKMLALGAALVVVGVACGSSEDDPKGTAGSGGDVGAAPSGGAGASGSRAVAEAGAGTGVGGSAGRDGAAGSGGDSRGASGAGGISIASGGTSSASGGTPSGGTQSSGGALSGAGNATGGVVSAGAPAGGGPAEGGAASGPAGGVTESGGGGNTKQCGPLPFSTCSAEEVCLRLETQAGNTTQLTWECGGNPCGEASIACSCAASLCDTWMDGAGCAPPLVPSQEDLTCRLEL